ncbi:hypothetical protein J1P26_22170 [Neobacillus sp. MM2021_6]|uniref:hypothetical protein n=1 Tax=Bacillaceae TaxID=186817 RepID=UPI001407AED8|nr:MULTISPECIES: hypothetical protein [Bacillaceae]MBO0962412.1 hypothetical protein [Neobacillus sp. MM2021_6]NHC21019.1 hypothetical protein [Bacillus sp. MM2020_4]WML39160.1 hypothetical protein RCG19_18505 [Neobacillus sp. OS1-2]
MPSVINLGVLNVNTPQQNSAVTVGQSIVTGMDANRKYNLAFGGTFGLFNIVSMNVGNNIDSLDGIDGVILDQDFKPNLGGNI